MTAITIEEYYKKMKRASFDVLKEHEYITGTVKEFEAHTVVHLVTTMYAMNEFDITDTKQVLKGIGKLLQSHKTMNIIRDIDAKMRKEINETH